MTGTQLSVLTGGGSSNGVSPARRMETGASQADVQFWHDVFDRAKGIGVEARATEITDAPPVTLPQHDASELGTQGDSARAPLRGATHALFSPGHVDLMTGLQRFMGSVVQIARPAWSGESRCVERPPISHVAGHDEGINPADTSAGYREPVMVVSETLSAAASLNAHVMQTAEGDWKVALRTGRKLSASQALSAVADALARDGLPCGQVSEVMLNGTCIYQQQTPSGAAASTAFELKC